MMAGMFFPVIPAGGSGTRLWPLSRSNKPKFLHRLTGGPDSLLQATVRRLLPVAPPQNVFVVTGAHHAADVSRQLPELPVDNILVEPSPRDSLPAIALAAALISQIDSSAIMGAFSADHYIPDPTRYREVLAEAIGAAESGYIVPIAVKPEYPEPGYGYVQYGESIQGVIHRVVQFKEKPSLEVATEWVRTGEFLWNTSMYVWRTDVFLSELERLQPEMYFGVLRIAGAWGGPGRDDVLCDVWPTLTKISLDYGVIEGASEAGIVVVAVGDFKWNDVGDFNSLAAVLPGDEKGNVVISPGEPADGVGPGDVLLDHTSRTLVVPQSGRTVNAVGLTDLVIIDTPDVLLVCRKDLAHNTKKLVESMRRSGRQHLL